MMKDHPESAWLSPVIPPESDVVVFAVALAGTFVSSRNPGPRLACGLAWQ